ncbi:MAG TPA: DUF6531 domain-containing protein, partial [bacterium]|nr:DUF6531 domain-containing protein [bacterium]
MFKKIFLLILLTLIAALIIPIDLSASCCGGTKRHPSSSGGCCGSGPSCGCGQPHLRGDGCGGNPTYNNGGNPVTVNDEINLINGNLIIEEKDLYIPGITGALNISRYKNNFGTGEIGAFGYGWSFIRLQKIIRIKFRRCENRYGR